MWTRADTVGFLRVPTPADDKYSRGVVALNTGSQRYPGAAVLGVEAAWRTGAGYVRYLGGAADAVLARRPETVTGSDLGRLRVDCWVIGSGTDAAQRSDPERAALQHVLAGTSPVVVDAGALDLVADATAPLVLTPHAGELKRLRAQHGLAGGVDDSDRLAAVIDTAQRLHATVLLKGARTLILAPDAHSPEDIIVVDNAPGWLATAGTGDVLGGILGALIAANPDHLLAETAAAAAWLHGEAGRRASGVTDTRPGHPIVALDVAVALPATIAELIG